MAEPRMYTVQWANGEAAAVLSAGTSPSLVTVSGDRTKVVLTNTNQEGTDGEHDLTAAAVGNLEFSLAVVPSSTRRAVMTEWLDQESGVWMVFGEIFVGDPDGTGGFGGHSDGGEVEPE